MATSIASTMTILVHFWHQQNSIRLARLAPDEPDTTSVPYFVWRHIDARDAIKISQLIN